MLMRLAHKHSFFVLLVFLQKVTDLLEKIFGSGVGKTVCKCFGLCRRLFLGSFLCLFSIECGNCGLVGKFDSTLLHLAALFLSRISFVKGLFNGALTILEFVHDSYNGEEYECNKEEVDDCVNKRTPIYVDGIYEIEDFGTRLVGCICRLKYGVKLGERVLGENKSKKPVGYFS